MFEGQGSVAFETEGSPFAGLAPPAITKLIAHSRTTVMQAGQVLFMEGDACRHLYVLIEGRVRCYQARQDGREQVVRTFDAPGDTFCFVAAFGAAQYVFSADAMTESRLHVVDVSAVRRLIAEHTPLGLAFLTVMTRQTRGLVTLVESLALRRVPERVARLLCQRAVTGGLCRGTGAELDRHQFREDEVASTVGSVRVHVSRILKELARVGALQLSRGTIRIPDLRVLERLSGE